MLEAADRLAERPALGRRRPDLLPDPFRFWSIPRYSLLLVYVADPTTPTILRVLSTDRDLGAILLDLTANPDEPGQG